MKRVPKPKPAVAARILDSAFAVLAEYGFQGGTMDRISVRANVSKPTLYTYLGSKEDLFAALLDHQKSSLLAPLSTQEPMIPAMVHFAETYARFALDPKTVGFGRMVIAEATRFPGIGRMYLEAGPDQALRGIMRYLDAQRQAGRLAFDDPELAAHDFWSLILSTPRGTAHFRPELSFDQLAPWRHVENGLRVFLRAYSTAPDRDQTDLEAALAAARAARTPAAQSAEKELTDADD